MERNSRLRNRVGSIAEHDSRQRRELLLVDGRRNVLANPRRKGIILRPFSLRDGDRSNGKNWLLDVELDGFVPLSLLWLPNRPTSVSRFGHNWNHSS